MKREEDKEEAVRGVLEQSRPEASVTVGRLSFVEYEPVVVGVMFFKINGVAVLLCAGERLCNRGIAVAGTAPESE